MPSRTLVVELLGSRKTTFFENNYNFCPSIQLRCGFRFSLCDASILSAYLFILVLHLFLGGDELPHLIFLREKNNGTFVNFLWVFICLFLYGKERPSLFRPISHIDDARWFFSVFLFLLLPMRSNRFKSNYLLNLIMEMRE